MIRSSILLSFILFFSISFSACNKNEIALDIDAPACVKKMVNNSEKGKGFISIIAVYEWVIDGNKYYYLVSECCDFLNFLFDDECNEICAPTGGDNGGGSMDCPSFVYGDLESETLLWQKER